MAGNLREDDKSLLKGRNGATKNAEVYDIFPKELAHRAK